MVDIYSIAFAVSLALSLGVRRSRNQCRRISLLLGSQQAPIVRHPAASSTRVTSRGTLFDFYLLTSPGGRSTASHIQADWSARASRLAVHGLWPRTMTPASPSTAATARADQPSRMGRRHAGHRADPTRAADAPQLYAVRHGHLLRYDPQGILGGDGTAARRPLPVRLPCLPCRQ